MLRAETVLTVAAQKIVKKLQLIMGHERVKKSCLFPSWTVTVAIPLKESNSLRISHHHKEP